MKTSLFDFELPDSLIARRPAEPRDAARMLVVNQDVQDRMIRELPAFLKPGDVLVFNDTRVLPARLLGDKGGSKVEVLLHKPGTPSLEMEEWRCFARPAKKLKPGDRIGFAEDFQAEVMEKLPSGEVRLRFMCGPKALHAHLQRYGHMPLPPYIEKQRKKLPYQEAIDDRERYQTVYAKRDGSVAAPTAGLHFTPELLNAIDAAGVKRVHVTLHVGGGTFLPVKVEDTQSHAMHSERVEIGPEQAAIINEAKRKGGRVAAVGTTSLRVLESAADEDGIIKEFQGETSIFITPGHRFKLVDVLLTNFHLPRSTLFMLVSAFSGLDTMQAAYAHAISERYRFYSYGDACLLYRA